MSISQREALGLVISCLGIAGLLAGFPGPGILLNNTLGYLLFAGAAVGALLFVIASWQRRTNLLGAGIVLGIFSAASFGSTFGTMWYFTSYLPANGGLRLEGIFETPSATRNSFVTYLKSGNFDKAYKLLSPDAQKQITDADTFRRIITENNWQPTKWKWTVEQADQAHAEYFAEVTFKGDRIGIFQLWLDKIEKHWKVSAMDFKPK